VPKYFLTARSEEITVEPLVMPKIGFEKGELVEVVSLDLRRGRVVAVDRGTKLHPPVYRIFLENHQPEDGQWFMEHELRPGGAIERLAELGRTTP